MYEALKTLIDGYINRNGRQAITGTILNGVLKAMVDNLGEGYQFRGVAVPSTAAPGGDAPLFYLAFTSGTYTNLGDIVVGAHEIALLVRTGGWAKISLPVVDTASLDEFKAEVYERFGDIGSDLAQIESDINGLNSDVMTLGDRLGFVEIVIPSAASEDNKLVDKETLDESIAFNTAHYISKNGNPFTSVEELEAYPKEGLTNNDYAVVVGVDEDEHTTYTYYVYNSETQSWAKEFVIDTLLTPFTDAQMAALNSGITAAILQSMQSQMEEMQRDIDGKQEQLVSGENIKTVNGQSLLGSGNIEIQGGAGDITDMNALASMVVATPTQQSFIERATPAGGIAYIPKVYGNSVKWNQLFINSATTSKSENGINATLADGVWTLNGTATAGVVGLSLGSTNIIGGHRYAVSGKSGIEAYIQSNPSSLSSEDMVFTASTSGNSRLYVLQIPSGTTLNNVKVRPRITDLTQMFGAGNEPTTYEEFLQRKPKVADEYAYNEGEIINLTATGIESRNAAGAVVASLPLNISDIVRADGTQLFPNGLRSAGVVRDMVDRVNGRAEKRIGVKVLDGTEVWEEASGILYFVHSAGVAGSPILCNYYPSVTVGWGDFVSLPRDKVINNQIGGSNPYIEVKDSSYPSVASWKAHLAELYAAGNPLVVYCKAAEPETVTFSPMKAFYKTEQGGTERLTGEDSAPIVADMGYKA